MYLASSYTSRILPSSALVHSRRCGPCWSRWWPIQYGLKKDFFLGGVWWAMGIINMSLAVSFSLAWFGFGVFLLLDGIPSKDKEPHLPKPYILQVTQSFNTNKVNLAFIQWGSLQWVPSGWNFRGNSLRPVARKVAHISGCYWLGLKEIGTLTVTRKLLD